jgi:hypothetical protein
MQCLAGTSESGDVFKDITELLLSRSARSAADVGGENDTI